MTDALMNVVDPEEDFCRSGGALYLPGAEKKVTKGARFMREMFRRRPKADAKVTQDAHHPLHIANLDCIQDGAGRNVDPFVPITLEDAKRRGLRCVLPGVIPHPEEPGEQMKIADYWYWYLSRLEQNGRYPYTPWPKHCLIGTRGYTFMPEYSEVLTEWNLTRFTTTAVVTKGSFLFSEHYSAVMADVQLPWAPETGVNAQFVADNEAAEWSLWWGFADTHCLINTLVDVADQFEDSKMIEKMVFIEDLNASVPGFEHKRDEGLDYLVPKGLKVWTSEKTLKELT